MEFDAPAEVKDSFNGRSNERSKVNSGHGRNVMMQDIECQLDNEESGTFILYFILYFTFFFI